MGNGHREGYKPRPESRKGVPWRLPEDHHNHARQYAGQSEDLGLAAANRRAEGYRHFELDPGSRCEPATEGSVERRPICRERQIAHAETR